MEFMASSPGQIAAIANLLQQSFGVSPDDPSVDLSYLNWKYYAEGPSWSGSRSYIVQSAEGEILAHGAIWPVQLQLRDGVRQGIGFGDWAASKHHPGAGFLLLKQLMTLSSFVLVTGGRQVTQKILPLAGFKPWAERPIYVKVLRPFRKHLRRKPRDLKAPLRFSRDLLCSLSLTASTNGWTVEKATPDDNNMNVVVNQLGSIHSPAFLRYLLTCPIVPFLFLVLRKQGELKGYCVVSIVHGQARLADLRIASECVSEKDRSAAVSAVVHFLSRGRDACEIMTFGSVPWLDKALLSNGFHLRGHMPTMVFDSRKQMTQEAIPQLGMLEEDIAIV